MLRISRKGFTLIEILLVVAILAFLVAILVPSVGNFGNEAKEKAVKADLNALRAAVEMYRVKHGSYPAQATWNTLLLNETSRLVDSIPADPYGNGTALYQYKLDTSGTHATYVVYSVGAGGTGNMTVSNDTYNITAGTPIHVTNAKAAE